MLVVIARSDLSAVAQRAKAEAAKQSTLTLRGEMDCFASLAMTGLARQEPPDRRHEENRKIDRKADVPQDRAKRRTIAEIGKDIGNPHDQKKDSQLIDQALRAGAKFRQQHGDRKERKSLDAVLMRAQRACPKRVVIERGVARFCVVETAIPDPLDRRDRQQIKHQRSENAPFGDCHGFLDVPVMGDNIETAIILTRIVQRAKRPPSCPRRRASSNRYRQLLSRLCAEYWIVRLRGR